MAGEEGLEPPTCGPKNRCVAVTPLPSGHGRNRTSDIRLFKPTFYQLNYMPVVTQAGLEPALTGLKGRGLDQLVDCAEVSRGSIEAGTTPLTLGVPRSMEQQTGFEPAISSLATRCRTAWPLLRGALGRIRTSVLLVRSQTSSPLDHERMGYLVQHGWARPFPVGTLSRRSAEDSNLAQGRESELNRRLPLYESGVLPG